MQDQDEDRAGPWPGSVAEDDEDYLPVPQRRARPPVVVERHLWRHSIESSALVIVGTIVGALVLHSVSLFWLTGVLAVLTFTLLYVSLVVTRSALMSVYLFAWGAVVTGWVTAERFAGSVWQTDILGPLFLALAILAPAGAVVIAHQRDAERKDVQAKAAKKVERDQRRWASELARAGIPGVTIISVAKVKNGKMIFGRLPRATDTQRSITFDQLARTAPELVTSLRLPADAVSFEQRKGGSSADFIMHIRETVGPREVIPLPAENHPVSINDPLAIGVLDSGAVYKLLVREITVLIIGVKGAGKSNLLNVFIAQLARCTDAAIFMIDLKGGRAARPWLMPWVLGHTAKPVIDWLATTRTEANIMLDALLTLGASRASSSVGWEKIIPSRDGTPSVVLLVDETAVMTGHNVKGDGLSNFNLAQKLATLVETYRSEAIDEIVAALRGNVDIMGTTGVKAMSEARIGLRVTQESDGRMVFPDDPHAAEMLSKIHDKGDGLVKIADEVSGRVHFYRIGGEEQITAIATSTGDFRPDLEERGVAAMGEAYSQRWDRETTQALLAGWKQAAGLLPVPAALMPQAAEDDEFMKIASHLGDLEDLDATGGGRNIDPRWKLMRKLLRDRGTQGYTVSVLARMIKAHGYDTISRAAIHNWLGKDEVLGYVMRTGQPLNRWVWISKIPLPDD